MIKDRNGFTVTKQEIIETLKSVKNGATIYSLPVAIKIRAIDENEETKGMVHIVDSLKDLSHITGEKYTGVEQLPYFGAITTEKGKQFIKKESGL